MRTEIDVDNSENRFRPGMYAKVTLLLDQLPFLFTLPAITLRSRSDVQGVWMVDEGKIRWVPVVMLMDRGDVVVVRGDLDVNSLVVQSSSSELQEGQEVIMETKAGSHS